MRGVIATLLTLARQPHALPLKPKSTLFERARQWINDNYAAIEDEDRRLDLYGLVDQEFKYGPSGRHVDILVITSDGTQVSGEQHVMFVDAIISP